MVIAHAPLGGWHSHPDVWLVVGALVAIYAIAVARLGPRHAPPGGRAVSRLQLTCFGLGALTIWLAADWPIHDVAEGSMYSVHMVQHLLIAMVAAPLVLLGTPGWMLRAILRPPSVLFRVARRLCRFFPALLVFNAVLVLTHWPSVVDLTTRSEPFHFFMHTVLFVSSLAVWMPVLSPLPEIPRLAPLPRMLFLFSQSVVPTVPASFLTFGQTPLYRAYTKFPHLWGLSSLEDQQTAGLIMKIGAGILLWMLIAVVFFRWAADEERRNQPRVRRALERELSEIGS